MTGFDSKRHMASNKQNPVLDIDGHIVGKMRKSKPAHSEWNAALDEAASRINEITAFPKTTQDSFAVFIQGLKK